MPHRFTEGPRVSGRYPERSGQTTVPVTESAFLVTR